MTEGSLDTSRSLCYFPDFSYKANTFIFYAKVIPRIYIKVGKGQLSRELPGCLSPPGSLPGLLLSLMGRLGEQRGHPSLNCACPSWVSREQVPGPSLSSTTSVFRGVRNGGSRSRRKLPVLKHTFPCLFVLFWGEGAEVPARPLPRLGRDQNAIIVIGTGASTNIEGNTQA